MLALPRARKGRGAAMTCENRIRSAIEHPIMTGASDDDVAAFAGVDVAAVRRLRARMRIDVAAPGIIRLATEIAERTEHRGPLGQLIERVLTEELERLEPRPPYERDLDLLAQRLVRAETERTRQRAQREKLLAAVRRLAEADGPEVNK